MEQFYLPLPQLFPPQIVQGIIRLMLINVGSEHHQSMKVFIWTFKVLMWVDDNDFIISSRDYSKVHTPPDAFGDWVTISPPINGRSKFWGNNLAAKEAPPSTHIFTMDQTVTVCFKTRPVVDSHKGFSASINEGEPNQKISLLLWQYFLLKQRKVFILFFLYQGPTTTTTATTITTTSQLFVNSFTSPNYPSDFPPNVDECWVQTPSDGHSVTLTFTTFDVRLLII